MLHSLLLLRDLSIAGAILWPFTPNGALSQAHDFINRGPWNPSAPFFNATDLYSPSLNTTGQSLIKHSNSSLEETLWPSLDTDIVVSSPLLDRHPVLCKESIDILTCSSRTNVCSGIVNVSETGQKPSIHSSTTQGRYTT